PWKHRATLRARATISGSQAETCGLLSEGTDTGVDPGELIERPLEGVFGRRLERKVRGIVSSAHGRRAGDTGTICERSKAGGALPGVHCRTIGGETESRWVIVHGLGAQIDPGGIRSNVEHGLFQLTCGGYFSIVGREQIDINNYRII